MSDAIHNRPNLSAIIVNHNSGGELDDCIESIKRQGVVSEIIIVDNGSTDGGAQRTCAAHPDITVIAEGINDGYAGGANRGAAHAQGHMLLFLNPDTVLEPGCLTALMDAASLRPNETLCAPVILDPTGERVEYGFTIDYAGDLVALPSPQPPLYVSGCAFLVSKLAFHRLGGFDASFFMFCEDLDLCWRALLRGYEIRVVPDAKVRHRGGGSTPGGYISAGKIEVTAFRIALRERNAIATVIHCGPSWWVMMVLPLRLVRLVLIALVALAIRRYDLSRALISGIAWNLQRLPDSVRKRRACSPHRRRQRSQILRERMLRDMVMARAIFRYGLPRFVDSGIRSQAKPDAQPERY